jgi:hypothetical protein
MGNEVLVMVIVAVEPTVPDVGTKLDPQAPPDQPAANTGDGSKGRASAAIRRAKAPTCKIFMTYFYSSFSNYCQVFTSEAVTLGDARR